MQIKDVEILRQALAEEEVELQALAVHAPLDACSGAAELKGLVREVLRLVHQQLDLLAAREHLFVQSRAI